jgi:hypothetical protein
MVMPELSILFTKKISKTDLMERLVLQQVRFLWDERKLPTIRPQYTLRQKINPRLNYKKTKSMFFSSDYLYTETLKQNEFVTSDITIMATSLIPIKTEQKHHFTTLKSGLIMQLTTKFFDYFRTFEVKIIDRRPAFF